MDKKYFCFFLQKKFLSWLKTSAKIPFSVLLVVMSKFFCDPHGFYLGKIAKPLKKMLKKLAADEVQAQLAVADSKLGGIIRECKSEKIFPFSL